jgi:hypothetical protein
VLVFGHNNEYSRASKFDYVARKPLGSGFPPLVGLDDQESDSTNPNHRVHMFAIQGEQKPTGNAKAFQSPRKSKEAQEVEKRVAGANASFTREISGKVPDCVFKRRLPSAREISIRRLA